MARIKRQFWALVMKYEPFRIGCSEFGTMYFPYKYRVDGYSLDDCMTERAWNRFPAFQHYVKRRELHFFVYRSRDKKWHLHEVHSGGFCDSGNTIDDAFENFAHKLYALGRARKARTTTDPLFHEQVEAMPGIETRPEIDAEQALDLLDRPRQHKLAQQRQKRIEKQHLESRLGKTQADHHGEPRPG